MATITMDKPKTAPRERATFIAQDWTKLLWVFTIISIAGLVGETIQHFVAFGEWESRAGFIWGPFSPIYGLAAVLLTVFLEPIAHRGWPLVFVVAAVIGGGLEYFASWAMETFWGVVAWSYLELPLNFDGRTDMFHMAIWGTLGLIWVKGGLPIAQKLFDHFDGNSTSYKVLAGLLAVFMAANIAVTVFVMFRSDARTNGVPAQNALEQLCDIVYPNEVLQDRFNNMGGIGIPD